MLLHLSKKQLAAIEAVLDIALHGGGALVRSAEIAERHGIAPRYLEPVLRQLGRSGILVGMRGPGGGYRLARERRRMSLWDLVEAMRGDEDAAAPEMRGGAAGAALARTLGDVEAEIERRLRTVTVEDLCWSARGGGESRAGVDFRI